MFRPTKLSYLFIYLMMGNILINPGYASYKKMGEEDVLFTVSKKLISIEQQLNSQSVLISPETLNWPEIEDFNRELMYAVAHDPNGSPAKDTPVELTSENLTERLKHSWMKLEESVFKIGTLSETTEWNAIKSDMDQFLTLRKDLYYQPARVMIKTGLLSSRIRDLRNAAAQYLTDSQKGKKITFKVSDPVLEELTRELSILNTSVRELDELRRPKVVEVSTIFQQKNAKELSILAAACFTIGIILTAIIISLIGFINRNMRRKKKAIELEKEEEQIVEVNHFDYNSWLKSLEKTLQSLKSNEDNLVEDILCLSNYCHEMKEARQLLNESETQEDRDNSLLLLNAASSKMEEYFEKLNIKKNSETSKSIMKHLVELCEAIEKGLVIHFKDKQKIKHNKTKIKAA